MRTINNIVSDLRDRLEDDITRYTKKTNVKIISEILSLELYGGRISNIKIMESSADNTIIHFDVVSNSRDRTKSFNTIYMALLIDDWDVEDLSLLFDDLGKYASSIFRAQNNVFTKILEINPNLSDGVKLWLEMQ